MNLKNISTSLIDWYKENARLLPWRETNDPYKIWISEVTLQQTRVAQGLPYYEKFVNEFPSIVELANAREQKVLRLWQGLGYYSRARNLHACAKLVVNNYNGEFPQSFEELKKLPGIGPYTAAAIASLAFRQPVAVVDGNVFRVLSRVFGIDKDIASHQGKKFFFELANKLIDKNRPDLFNQAMMEFGALHCLPRNPKCSECIFSRECIAKQKELQHQLPVKSKKIKVQTRHFFYFVIYHKNKILMKPRQEKDIWRGLYEFYLIETANIKNPESVIKKNIGLRKFHSHRVSQTITHILSHQKLKVKFIEITANPELKINSNLKRQGYKWFSKKQANELPKPALIELYFKKNHDLNFW